MIKAIETNYKGYRFRSRLEARWAVFFDAMEIEWLYEPEGLKLSHRLTNKDGDLMYLPDFWLPGLGLWAEVKGWLTPKDCFQLLDAAACLSNNGSGCGGHEGDMIVLGQIPNEYDGNTQRYPVSLHMHKGTLIASVWPVEYPTCYSGMILSPELAYDYGDGDDNILADYGSIEDIISLFTEGFGSDQPATLRLQRAFKAARQARFEHGESPRT